MQVIEVMTDWLNAALVFIFDFALFVVIAIAGVTVLYGAIGVSTWLEAAITRRFGPAPMLFFRRGLKLSLLMIGGLLLALFVWLLSNVVADHVHRDGTIVGVLKFAWSLVAAPFYVLGLLALVFGPFVLIGAINDRRRKVKRQRDAHKKT